MHDVHCHILPFVDDGPSDIEGAVEMVRSAEKAGVESIICTPHYIDDGYKSTVENNVTILEKLKKVIERENIKVKFYLGNEVYITPNIERLLDLRVISTLNNSRYILIEMPIYNKPIYIDDIVFKLRLRGLVPVIAHPERYEWIIKNTEELSDLINKGCIAQLNMASIRGYYGERVKKTAKMLLKEDQIRLLGSDSHSSNKIYSELHIDLKILQKILSDYKMKQILDNNEAVINNQLIHGAL